MIQNNYSIYLLYISFTVLLKGIRYIFNFLYIYIYLYLLDYNIIQNLIYLILIFFYFATMKKEYKIVIIINNYLFEIFFLFRI